MSIGSQMLRFKTDQLYICPDFETCHLNLANDNWPWQLAWVIGDGKKVYERHNYLINWGFPLPVSRGAAQATGFRQDLVDANGYDPLFVYNAFDGYLSDPQYIVVAHNWIGFDSMIKAFYARQLKLAHSYDYLSRLIDTNCVEKAIRKGIKPDVDNLLQWQYKMTTIYEKGLKTNLGACLDAYEIEVDRTKLHKADYDVEKNLQLWQKQMWKVEI